MINFISNNIINYFIEKKLITEEYEIYRFGLSIIVSYSVSAGVILIFGFISKHLLEAFTYLFFFDKLREYGGGYHANSYLKCNITFIIIYLANNCLVKLFSFSFSMILALICISFLINYLPVEHPNKPISLDKRKTHQIIAIRRFLIVVYFSAVTRVFSINLAIFINITLIAVCILCFIQLTINERREKNEKVF